jgi:hypothetical protein
LDFKKSRGEHMPQRRKGRKGRKGRKENHDGVTPGTLASLRHLFALRGARIFAGSGFNFRAPFFASLRRLSL